MVLAGDQQPPEAGAQEAEVDCQLRRVGAGDEVDQGDQVEEPLAADPPAPPDDLVLHQRDMRRRPAEGGEAEASEHERDLAKAGGS